MSDSEERKPEPDEPPVSEPVDAGREEPVSDEVLAEAVAEAIVEEALEEAVAEAIIEEAVAEAIAEEVVAEAIAEEAVEEAVAEAIVEEALEAALTEEIVEQALAQEASQETVAAPQDAPKGLEYIDEEPAPRVKPVIPGADLIPDIVTEGDQFLSAEAQAAAEAEAEEAALRAAEQEASDAAAPIAGVAIDLAAGARYTATGKRKTAVARVILKPGTGTYVINGKSLEEFFPRETLQRMIRQPLETVAYESRMDVIARMHGGGVSSQAGALRHGISRALIAADPHLRGELKRRGFLTRDPRVKERKKAGLKKARKRPQFSKR